MNGASHSTSRGRDASHSPCLGADRGWLLDRSQPARQACKKEAMEQPPAGPVTRARVCDLINTDPDQRPLSPPQRVAGHCFQHSDFFR